MVQQMMQQQQQDPLMAALGHQQMLGEMMSKTAKYKMEMYKLKQKYGTRNGAGVMPPGQPQPQQQQPPQPMPQPNGGL